MVRYVLLAACATATPPLQHTGGAGLLSEDGIATMLDGEPITAERLHALFPGTTVRVERQRIDVVDTGNAVLSVEAGIVNAFDPRVTTASGLRVGSTVDELHRAEPKFRCGVRTCVAPQSRFTYRIKDGRVASIELVLAGRPRAARKEWVAEDGGLGPIDVTLAPSALAAALPDYTTVETMIDGQRAIQLVRDGAVVANVLVASGDTLAQVQILSRAIPTRLGTRVGDTVGALRTRDPDATCEQDHDPMADTDLTRCHAAGLAFATGGRPTNAPPEPGERFTMITVPLR